MPAIGVIDPSHKERKDDKSGRLPRWFGKDEVLEAALNADPRWSPWTYEVLAAALGEIQERGNDISTTALTGPCPRSTVLERLEDFVLRMEDIWRAFRGTMIHYVLEGTARPGTLAEHRFFAPFDGDDVLSCSPDLLSSDTIWDYKNTAKNPAYDYPYTSHSEQLQLNRYIVNHATRVEYGGKVRTKFPFDYRTATFQHLVIVYLDLDGPKQLETLKTVKVDGRSRGRREPYIWSDDEVLQEFTPRFQSLRAALEAYPEWPSGIETLDWWGPNEDARNPWKCPGWPWCPLRGKCLASSYPNGLVW